MFRLFITLFIVLNAVAQAKPAPTFKLKDQNGKAHDLSQYKGKYVVLEWTNSDCPFVIDHYERRTMIKTSNKFKDKNVVWLAVNSSHFNTPKDSIAWANKNGLSYPTLQDPDGKVGKLYEAKTTPHMFVIDPKGDLIYQGAIDDDKTNEKKQQINYVEQALNQAMSNSKIDPAKTDAYGCKVKYK